MGAEGVNETERAMHLRAGQRYGVESTCKDKIDYKSEHSAERSARAMTRKTGRAVEAYPCIWCDGWHIGREMTREEREQFNAGA